MLMLIYFPAIGQIFHDIQIKMEGIVRIHSPTMARLCSDPHAICGEKDLKIVENAC